LSITLTPEGKRGRENPLQGGVLQRFKKETLKGKKKVFEGGGGGGCGDAQKGGRGDDKKCSL